MKRVSPLALLRTWICLVLSLAFLTVAPINTFAHRSGCHRWHSCPSDSGSYICGDTGHCSQCPDNQYCQAGSLRVIKPSASSAPAPAGQSQATVQTGDVRRIDYEGFTVWLDCSKRGAVKFRYNAQRDQGNFKRHERFYYDPDVPKRCQQTSTKSYKHPSQRYDRGHIVPANHLDYSMIAIKQSNYMTNILPQHPGRHPKAAG
jgi:DNA/RNA endonuclease G (NUC1)